ncbi:MAG: triosephosphate isomerase, partial [Caulobacteraceae bacterium]|nr:triosephosphate isomerase [Caulobacter sp.]
MAAGARKTVVGNWKCNGLLASLDEVRALIAALDVEPATARVGLCPPATLLHGAVRVAEGSVLEIGAQDVSADGCGAHTGDLAAAMLADAGARMVIVGHSERRADRGETDAMVAAKARAALAAGLEPIICVGETE